MEGIWEVRIFAHRKWLYRTDRGSHQLNLNTEKAVSLTAGRYALRDRITEAELALKSYSFSEFHHINGTVFFVLKKIDRPQGLT